MADIDIVCGRYGAYALADIICGHCGRYMVVADMVCGRYRRFPAMTTSANDLHTRVPGYIMSLLTSAVLNRYPLCTFMQ